MRRLARALPYLAILLIPLIALVVLLRAGPLAEHLRRVVESEFSRVLERDVNIARASLTLSGRLTLRDISVRNPDGSLLLKVPEVSARIGKEGSWLPLLSQPTEVRGVTLIRPEISLSRDPRGVLSIGDLMARQGEKPSRFRGEVVVQDGRLEFVDDTRGGVATVIEGADFKLHYPRPTVMVFSLNAPGSEGQFDRLRIKGEQDSETGITRISGSIAELDIAYALARAPAFDVLDIPAGRTDVEGEIALREQGGDNPGLEYDLRFDVKEATVAFPWLRRPIEGIAGRVRLADNGVHLSDLSGTVAEAPISASGTISNLLDPTFDLDLSVTGIRYPQVSALFPKIVLPAGLVLPSPLRISARVEGPASNIKVTGEGTVRVIKFRAIPWNDLVGEFEYSNGRLKLSGLHAHGSPRRITGDLIVDWRTGRSKFEGNLELSEVPLAVLAQMAGVEAPGLSGTASVKATAKLDGEPSVAGRFRIRDAVVNGLPLGRLEGDFELAGGRLRIPRGAVEGAVATGSFGGALSPAGDFELQANLASLDLSALTDALGGPQIDGVVQAEIRARGNPRATTGSGQVKIGPGEVQGHKFERLEARLDISPARLQVANLLLRMGAGEYRSESLSLTNWLMGWASAKLAGTLTVKGGAVADWLPPEYAAAAPKGVLDGEIELSGSPADPRLALDLTLESVTVAGQSFNAGRVLLSYDAGRLVIEEMFLDDRGSRLVVRGSHDPSTGLDLGIAAAPLDLRRIAPAALQRYGVMVEGRITGAAKIVGPLADPKVEFHAESDSLRLNQEKVERFALSGRYEEGAVHVDSGTVEVAGGSISLSGGARLRDRTIDASIALADLDIGRLYKAGYLTVWRLARLGVRSPYLSVYAGIPHPLTGLLSSHLHIGGTLDQPLIEAKDVTFLGLGYAGRNIGRIEGDAEVHLQLGRAGSPLRQARATLVASDEMGDARISGGVAPDGNVSLVVDSLGQLDLSLLGPWLQYPLGLSGQATVNFDISGPLAKPVMTGDIWVDNLQLGPFQAEQAMAGPISVRRGVLTVEEIRFTNPPQEGVPLTEATGRAAFPLFPGNGPTGEPQVTTPQAELHVKNGTLALVPEMQPALFDADVYLRGRKLILGQPAGPDTPGAVPGITGRLGSGRFSITGQVELRRPAPQDWRQHHFDLSLEFDSAELVVPGLASARLDGALWLTNMETSPEQQARETAWSVLGSLYPALPTITTEVRDSLYGPTPAILKTRPGKPIVVSEPALIVPKLRSLKRPGKAAAGPYADIEVRVGSPDTSQPAPGWENGPPTDVVVDLGLLKMTGPASGRLHLSGELSAEGYTLEGKVNARDGRVSFPNAVLTLSSGTVEIQREKGRDIEIGIVDAEAAGRVGDYNITMRPSGRVYPLEEPASGGGSDRLPPLPLNVNTIPYLDPAIAVALLWGPVVAPTRGGGRVSDGQIQEPGRGGGGTGEITGVMLPTLGGSGAPELSLDLALQGPARMRLGERLFSRVLLTYVSPVSGPEGSRSLGITYEVVPPLVTLGWSVDELDRKRWELRAFRSF